ncbi:hypothetical protein L6452_21994 [Arctium lappa]|uniref:Uncharacterized protein n=1 Tax=Arctium lappa TaxID=4217 RepID=A0ACB9AZE8_ARCLA|nr:hypothetical protein L6452_21994 [Arctium lappa]
MPRGQPFLPVSFKEIYGRQRREIGSFQVVPSSPGDGKKKVIDLGKPIGANLSGAKGKSPSSAAAGSSEWSCAVCKKTCKNQSLSPSISGDGVIKLKNKSAEIGLGVAPKKPTTMDSKVLKSNKSVNTQPPLIKNSSKCVPINSKKEDKKSKGEGMIQQFLFSCEMCNVGASSDKVMNAHIKGKKHLKNLLKLHQEAAAPGNKKAQDSVEKHKAETVGVQRTLRVLRMDNTQESAENQTKEIQVEKETREEMLSRHRKEITQLQNKEIALKKAAAKGSKAEQKAKKKQVEEQISQLTTELKEKHVAELASVGYASSTTSGEGKENNIEILAKAIAGVSVTNQAEHSKPSKSAKRKEKRAQQEAAREQRIQEEQSNIVSDRMVENEKLQKKLEPLGLLVHEIKPDGHCLYRAVEDQLKIRGLPFYTFQELRKMVADYMRKNSSDFLPFFLSETVTDGDYNDSVVEKRFESYCNEVESTAAWGGQLELGALTHCLKKHIMIFSGSFPDVEMGKEYKSGDSSELSIMLSYHKHAFGLGEHYNSVVPV